MGDKYQLLGPLKPEEYEALKKDIEKRGVQVAVEVDEKGITLDGHHRRAIADELGIKYKTVTKRFKTEAEKRAHVLLVNMARRHMAPHEWGAAFKKILELRGVKRGRGGDRRSTATVAVDTAKEVAAELGVASRTAEHRLALADDYEALPKAEKEAVDEGEKTVKGAKRDVKNQETKASKVVAPAGKFRVVYADPPWSYGSGSAEMDQYGPAGRHYPQMSIKDLCALELNEKPVVDCVMDDAVLFLWVTSPLLGECWPVIKAWGFKYKSSFVWDKVKHNYGHYNSVRHELLLICTRGKCTPDKAKLYDSVQTIERTQKHSEKPKEFRQIIDDLYPKGPRIELFGRKKVKGWRIHGNELS